MNELREEIYKVSHAAADAFFKEQMQGEDRGCCGFAWVSIYPEHKGNTKLGKAERREFEALGATKDWTGKVWMIWNPAKYPVQNIDTLEAGARAASKLLNARGYKAAAQSRLD